MEELLRLDAHCVSLQELNNKRQRLTKSQISQTPICNKTEEFMPLGLASMLNYHCGTQSQMDTPVLLSLNLILHDEIGRAHV